MSGFPLTNTILQEIDDLNREAWSLNRKNAVESIALANEALSKSLIENYVRGIALAKKTLGACHVWISKNEEAANYCFEAITLFQSINDSINEAETNYYLGANFFYLSDYDSSIKYYKNSYDISARIQFEPGMADGLNGMGTVYYTIEHNEKALEVLEQSEALCQKHNVKEVLVKVKDGLGETYYNLKEYEKALKYYYECIELTDELNGFYQVKAFAMDGLGRTYTGLKDYSKALECYQQSLDLRKELGFKFGVATTLNNIGKLYVSCLDNKNAIKYLKEAFELSTEIGSKEGVFQSSERLAELYEKNGEADKALEYYKIFHQAKEDVRNHKSAQLSKSLELQNKVLQSQAEKAILEERAKELENFSESLTVMSQIGQQIISSLSVETIVNTVYKSVNGLMDASGFGIGLYKKENNTIVYPLYIEGDDKFENVVYELEDNNRLTSLCFNEQREIVINDFVSEISNFIKQGSSAPKAGRNVESIIYLPLKYKDSILGVVTAQSFNKNAYSNYHLNIFKNLATYTAIALENAKLYEEQEQIVEERTQELLKSKEEIERTYLTNKKINEIGREITSNLNLGKIFKKLYNSINEVMSVECFGVRIYKPEVNGVEYRFEMERGEVYDEIITVPLTDDDNYTVWCIKNRKDIFLNDNRKEYSKYVKQIKVVSGDMPNSLMFTPMMIGEKLIGVITVQSFQYNAYLPYHLEILKTLATYTATALENAYLYEYMEDKVKERTVEVVKQKEQIEQTFENTRLVSEIGKEISSTFSINEIISRVYNSVNKLMDATMFGIGIYDPITQRINFSGVIENGRKLEDYFYTLENTDRPAVWCYTTQKDYVIHNFTEEFINSKKIANLTILQGDATESIIYVPVTQNDKKIGVLTVQSYKANAYSDYHLQLIKSLAIYAAIAIDNASLYNNMEAMVIERTEEITTAYENTRLLSQIAEDISSSLSVETISSKLYKNVNKVMDATMFGIGLYNAENNTLEFKGFVENNQVMDDFTFAADDVNRLAVYCFRNEQDILIHDYTVEYVKYIKGIMAPVSGKDSSSVVYIPLYAKGKIIGLLTVQSYEKNAYSEYQFNILKNLAVSIGIALDNASLYQNLEQKVQERTAEVHKQKAIIEEKNKDITDSIRYAKKIQQAIAPNIDEFNRNFTDSFILYKPKDIVSGDFYWFDHFDNEVTVFAAADCTGHGVPGAFMSLICSDIMYKVINDQKIHDPAGALTGIDERLVQLIKKSSEASANDGMDIALCTYYKKENKLQFAGAHRPLLLIRNKEIIEYRPNKYSIGGHSTEGKHFDLTEVAVQPGDLIYLLTDGYADQFGGDNGKKFKFKNFKELVLSVSNLRMSEQKQILDETFESWRGSLEQIDDVCVMAVKI
jgi:transcriptional regulator with GAF, ATPase, and Fis domain